MFYLVGPRKWRNSLKKLIPSLLAVLLLTGSVYAGLRYTLSVPYLTDNVLRRELRRGNVRTDIFIKDDNVVRWMKIAKNRDNETKYRVNAIKRLHEYRQERVKRVFVALLGDRSMAVREQCILGLGKLNFPSTVPILIESLRYCRGRARQATRKSLKMLTGNDFGNDIRAWRNWFKQHRRDYR